MRRETLALAGALFAGCLVIALAIWFQPARRCTGSGSAVVTAGVPGGSARAPTPAPPSPEVAAREAARRAQDARRLVETALKGKRLTAVCGPLLEEAGVKQLHLEVFVIFDAAGEETVRGLHRPPIGETKAELIPAAQCALRELPRVHAPRGPEPLRLVVPVDL